MLARNIAAVGVLRNSDLYLLVTCFQDGVYHDLRRLVRCYRRVLPHHQASFLVSALPLHRILFRLFNCRPRFFTSAVLDAVISFGHADAAAFLIQKQVTPSPAAAILAAAHGHIATLNLVLEAHKSDTRIMDVAAENGHLELIAHLDTHGLKCSPYAMDRAAGRGRLDIVSFLHQTTYATCTTIAMDLAAANGHLEIVRFLHVHRSEGCTTDAIDDAALRGHLDVVVYLHQSGRRGTVRAMEGAARHGHMQIVEFLEKVRK
ncbi:Aste57867_2202 [Aphanomyces stellatus]|uniref:Aste57867_2202 protein n=1 Tax=Aphanomyces stellatus TaxID=120398 RepID=A0A485K7Q0_9STRA|nr:hypothetical protein As57867_002197 [Aphanomyces stellatus]VFT79405.1 Aste57867_2202 [Aphanomyces stellatus]